MLTSSSSSIDSSATNAIVVADAPVTIQIDLNKLKEYFQSKGGRVKYSDLFNSFKDIITNNTVANENFHELLHKIANKKLDDNLNEEWWHLKKKYSDNSSSSSNFLVNTIQKTKQNLSKFESRLTNAFNSKDQNNTTRLASTKLQQVENNVANRSSINISITSEDKENLSKVKNEEEKLITTSSFDETSNNVKSVKEHAKKLNRLNTESELNNLVNNSSTTASTSTNTLNNKYKRYISSSYILKEQQNKQQQINMTKNLTDLIECLDLSSNNTKPHEKEWIVVCSKIDSYMDTARILSKHAYLAQKKDPFNACKHGNIEIIKLLASTLENDKLTNPKMIRINHLLNTRSGYTCLHIAYIFGNTHLISTLVQYGAQTIPDYSGKLGIEYTYAISSNASIVIDTHDIKSSLLDFSNDANAIIKRNSAKMMQKEKRQTASSTFYADITSNLKEPSNENDEETGQRDSINTIVADEENSNINRLQNLLPSSSYSTPSGSPARSSDRMSIDSNILMPPPKTIPQMKFKKNKHKRSTSNSNTTSSTDTLNSIPS